MPTYEARTSIASRFHARLADPYGWLPPIPPVDPAGYQIDPLSFLEN